MTDIIDVGTDLLDVFIERENIDKDNIRLNDDDIKFALRTHDSEDDAAQTIRRGDIKDVDDFFANSLQSRPFARHLLLLLWIRETKFKTKGLEEERVYEFFHKGVFAFHDVDLDEETLWNEFEELLDEDYFQDTCLGFMLSPKGVRTAESMFKNDTLLDEAIAKLEKLAVTFEERLPLPSIQKLAEAAKPKKKRRSKAERRGVLEFAIEYQSEHLNMDDNDITAMFMLERGALSKPEAVRLKEECIKRQRENAKSNRLVDEHIGNDLVYNNTGISKR